MANSNVFNPEQDKKYNTSHSTERDTLSDSMLSPNSYNKISRGLTYGIIAGLLVGIYEWLVLANQDSINIGLSILGFILMAPVLWYAIRDARSHYPESKFFINAAILAMYVSFFASLVTAALEIVGFTIAPTELADAVSVEGVQFSRLLANCAFQIFVGTVIGNIIAFIFLQGYKTSSQADKYIN